MVGVRVAATHGRTGELDAVGTVEEPVEDGLGEGRVGHRRVPVVDGHLAGDQGRAQLRPVLHDLEKVSALLDRGGGEQEVIEDQQLDTAEGCEQTCVAAVGSPEGEVVEQSRGADVERRVSLTDGGMGHGAAEEGLPASGGAGDDQVLLAGDPSGAGEAEHGAPVESPRCPEVDFLDGGAVAQLGGLEAGLDASCLAPVGLAVDEETQTVLEAEVGIGAGVVELVTQGGGHGAKPDRLQLGDGGLWMHHAPSSV